MEYVEVSDEDKPKLVIKYHSNRNNNSFFRNKIRYFSKTMKN